MGRENYKLELCNNHHDRINRRLNPKSDGIILSSLFLKKKKKQRNFS